MPRIKKIQENEATVYPVTIPEAVVLPDTQEKLSDILSRIGSAINDKVDSTAIVDNLNTEDATSPLSAKQGRVLARIKQDSLTSGNGISIVNDVISVRFNKSDDDITGPDSNGAYTLKDRAYNSLDPNGLGYVILKKKFSFASQVTQENTIYEIRHDFSLGGEAVIVPAGCKLVFNGGKLLNGTLEGTDTEAEFSGTAFSGITIGGTWKVPYISSDYFADAQNENGLVNLFNMSSASIYNHIDIRPGTYQVSQTTGGSYTGILFPKSNTHVTVEGTIQLLGTAVNIGRMFHCLNVNNVIIEGSGTLVGDRDSHIGSSGESFHGVMVSNSSDIVVRGLTVRDFWGDCVCIGGSSNGDDLVNTHVRLEALTLSNSRRQGISVIYADGVEIINCSISNVNGTAPQSGIDIEPNGNGYCYNIDIRGCNIFNCAKAGFQTYAPSNGQIKNVSVKNCTFTSNFIAIKRAYNVSFDNITMSGTIDINSGESIIVSNSRIPIPTAASGAKNVLFQNCTFPCAGTSSVIYAFCDNCTFTTDTEVNFTVQLYGGGRNLSFSEIPSVYLRGDGMSYNNIKLSTSKRFSTDSYPVQIFDGVIVEKIHITTNYTTAPYAFISVKGGDLREVRLSVEEGSAVPSYIGYILPSSVRDTSFTGLTFDFAFTGNMFDGGGKNTIILRSSGLRPYGDTASRPLSRFIGTCYFDTTIGKPIYWSGSSWVDATGTSV